MCQISVSSTSLVQNSMAHYSVSQKPSTTKGIFECLWGFIWPPYTPISACSRFSPSIWKVLRISWLNVLIAVGVLHYFCYMLGTDPRYSSSFMHSQLKKSRRAKSWHPEEKPHAAGKQYSVGIVMLLNGLKCPAFHSTRLFWLFYHYGNIDLSHHGRAWLPVPLLLPL